MVNIRAKTIILGLTSVAVAACGNLTRDNVVASTSTTIADVDATVPIAAQADASVSSECPANMKFVRGSYCPDVEQKCLRWLPSLNKNLPPGRCAEFAPSVCRSLKRVDKRFCIDTYEYPNQEGVFPRIDVTWYEAKKTCESLGKRLCTADEWTFACEGESSKPYPYGDGLRRDDVACNIDGPSMPPDKPRSEWPKYNLSEPSGVRPGCVSPFGVRDMTGNIDEWVVNEGGRRDGDPYVSGLKGGYWSTVRNRCRPMTTAHGPTYSFYQQGFRCCSDAGKSVSP